ncbi:ABC transporter permease [Gordonia sp. DT218]|uniref:ABC transporter permease n=1 Tax=unclassified Gordonia (in: high G+C Gram-positive bacteria) TaxID=2657482 RepID=UPI003CF46ED3
MAAPTITPASSSTEGGRDLLAKSGRLVRLMTRRERWIIVITLVVFLLINLSTAATISSSYPTSEKRAALQVGAGSNSAFRFLLGPLDHVDSAAAVTVWRAGLFMIAALAVCAVMMVVRQTRKEEELGRAELLRAGATGPLASLWAATVVSTAFCVVVALGMSVMLFPLGAGVGDVIAVFAQYVTTAMAAVGVALVSAQIAKTSHIANLTASSIVLAGYVLRGVADVDDTWSWLRWITPVGWAELIDPFGANNPWPAVASLAVAVLGVGLAARFALGRDLDAGLISPRPGPASSTRLSSVRAVAVRLSGSLLYSWTSAITLYALVIGFLQPSVDELAGDNEQMRRVLEQSGLQGDLSTLFGSTMMTFLAVAASAWSVNVVTRMRSEEVSSRTEVLLVTPTSRSRYLAVYAATAAVGVVVILIAAALGMTVGNGVAGGGWSAAGDNLAAAGVQIPAALLVSGIAVALYAFRPMLVPVGWLVVIAALFLGPLSGMFSLPQWARDLSPFSHAPAVPLEPMQWLPIVVLLAIAALFAVAAQLAFHRRDIG